MLDVLTPVHHQFLWSSKKKSGKGQQELACQTEVLADSLVRIAREAKSEKSKLFQIFSRQGSNETKVASMARWEEHLRMFTVLERECLELREK